MESSPNADAESVGVPESVAEVVGLCVTEALAVSVSVPEGVPDAVLVGLGVDVGPRLPANKKGKYYPPLHNEHKSDNPASPNGVVHWTRVFGRAVTVIISLGCQ